MIVDADAGNNRRRIISFIGGLDICDGRYDTPQHPIFRTLQTTHVDDYHNPTFAVIANIHVVEEFGDVEIATSLIFVIMQYCLGILASKVCCVCSVLLMINLV